VTSRFGPSAPRRSCWCWAASGELTANTLLCEPKDLRLPAPTVQAQVAGDGDSCVVVLTSDVLALRTMLTLDGAEARWSDNVIDHLLPGQSVEVVVTPERPLAPAELEQRLRTRSLCTSGPQHPTISSR
jgi:hypothetical protein